MLTRKTFLWDPGMVRASRRAPRVNPAAVLLLGFIKSALKDVAVGVLYPCSDESRMGQASTGEGHGTSKKKGEHTVHAS